MYVNKQNKICELKIFTTFQANEKNIPFSTVKDTHDPYIHLTSSHMLWFISQKYDSVTNSFTVRGLSQNIIMNLFIIYDKVAKYDFDL